MLILELKGLVGMIKEVFPRCKLISCTFPYFFCDLGQVITGKL